MDDLFMRNVDQYSNREKVNKKIHHRKNMENTATIGIYEELS